MLRPPAGSRVAITLAFGLIALQTARADYSFRPMDDHVLDRRLRAAAVRIFRSSDAAKQFGSGFVIDNQAGLILTAGHVAGATGDQVLVAFPDSQTQYAAQVLLSVVHTAANPTADFALLKFVKPPPRNFSELEVEFDG